MENLVLPRRVDAARVGHLAVRHDHGDLCAQVLLVKAKRLRAIAAVIEISVELHGFEIPFR
jgi:hypothetical protein